MNRLAKALALSVAAAATPSFAEMPGLAGGDHIGFTVPNLEEAVGFFQNVIGCEAFYPLGPFSGGDSSWMKDHLNVDAKATIPGMRLMRCGYGLNLEIFSYSAPDQNSTPPRNSDVGGHHIAFYVEDMAEAVKHLRDNGVKVLGEPTTMTEGPSSGETWVYFMAPWGMQLELVSYPEGKAYVSEFDGRLWSATVPGQ